MAGPMTTRILDVAAQTLDADPRASAWRRWQTDGDWEGLDAPHWTIEPSGELARVKMSPDGQAPWFHVLVDPLRLKVVGAVECSTDRKR
jgi:hypothetical protein